MTPSSLAHSLLHLRELVEREDETIHILHSIDSFSLQLTTTERRLSQAQDELHELRSETKKLKNRNKKLENEVCQCQQQRDQLASELQKAQDIHRNKVQKMVRLLEAHPNSPQASTPSARNNNRPKCSFGAQCQIFTSSAIQQLQEKSQILQRRMEHLEQSYEEQLSEGKAKDLYIEELTIALETEGRRRTRSHDQAQEDEKENDNSTLDDDSEKDSEFALPEWLETADAEPSESVGQAGEGESEERVEEAEGEEKQGWLDVLRRRSAAFCAFILG